MLGMRAPQISYQSGSRGHPAPRGGQSLGSPHAHFVHAFLSPPAYVVWRFALFILITVSSPLLIVSCWRDYKQNA